MSYIDEMNDVLEPLKVESALKSEEMKLNYRKQHKPKDVNILDFTVIEALKKQIGYKPNLFKQDSEIYNCKCGKLVGHKDSYCKHCGQKLDW